MNVLIRPDGFFRIIGPTSDPYLYTEHEAAINSVERNQVLVSTHGIRYRQFRTTELHFNGGASRTVNFWAEDPGGMPEDVMRTVEWDIRGINDRRIEWDRKPTSLMVENEIRRKALGIKAGVLFTLFSPDSAGMVSVALDMFESSDGNLALAKAYLNGEITGPEIA